ncbi:hypothetical protein Tco_0403576 [Tanacetum coccineum]
MVYLGNEPGSKAYRLFDPITQRICVSRDVKFKENETWDWKDYMSEHTDNEPEWTDFRIGNLEHHDHEIQPLEEDNEFPSNNDDDYASPRNSPTHSQPFHTPSTRSSEINSQDTLINSSLNLTIKTLNDLYENTEELLLAEDEPKNYKESSNRSKSGTSNEVELVYLHQ